ncbi:MAG TPA: ABC transporter ATP-binding protein [Bacillota bacterium]|jgi:branched-chain amino acid transport system ATP-binding protein|nr:ABC transporter ATP-binding protein [Peptococcaceae bacterium MAG4]NLW37730.1 ABC transporter ATP-binding protein [Peptococcaceae bacterium]HPZ43205.1 ABC transporter ATP-binding protein [Bacillota bacterium]HQD76049.1 ABC transporter ATP-binding protein [Bacillota bacterium]HUM58447.1 ABC transporter ATP-binding protein [Bacillota bacterium]
MLLNIDNITVSYGGVRALRGVSCQVEEGEIVALIGANGAGKSTTLKAICGLVRPQSGTITFDNKVLNKMPPHKIVSLGISQVPEGRRVFTRLTVLENLEMGGYTRKKAGEVKDSIKNIFKRFPRLEERKNQLAGTLSGGEQQMLAIGRALMSKPRLLLLDEPSMGLAPMLVQEIFTIISEINLAGTTILLVEQNANMALSIANWAYVLETGEIVLSGPAAELANNPDVRKAYLGE